MSDLFNITLESNILSGTADSFDLAVTDGGDMSVSTVSAMGYGTYGAQCLLDDINAMYGQKIQTAPASNEIRYRFYIDPNTLNFAVTPNKFIVLRHVVTGAPWLLTTVQLRHSGAIDGYFLRCHAYNDAGGLVLVDVPITDAQHWVELHVERASTNIAGDGRVRLWVDDALKYTWDAVDNFDAFAAMARFRLGAPNGVDASITGTFYIDEFRANDDGTKIGRSGPPGLQLLIDGVDRTTLLIHETLTITQTNDGLNSTCTFDLLDQAVIREDVWTVGLTHITDDGHVITGYPTFFPQTKVEISIADGDMLYFAGTLARISATHMGQLEIMPGFTEPETQVLRCECQDFNQILEEMVIDEFREFGGMQDELLIDAVFDDYVFPFGNPIDYASFVTAVPYVFDLITFDSITVRQFMDTVCAQTKARWYVDYEKKLHYAASEAVLAPDWHLSDLPDEVDSFRYFDDITKEKDATNLVNRVFVVCGTDLLPVSLWFIDQESIDKYGSHRAIVRDTTLFDIDDIEAKGNTILEKFKDPIVTYVLKTYKSGLRAGMYVRVVCAFYDLDETFLINNLVITFPVDGTPVYEITCGGLDSSASGSANRYNLDQIHLPNITPSSLPIAARGWGHDLEFSATDDDTVEWTAGTITTADGQEFNIAPGADTGDMAAVTYVYLDTGLSLTALQHSINAVDSIGLGKILIAVCAPDGAVVPTSAMYQVFGGGAGVTAFLHADNIAANCITANEIYGNTLSVVAADMGLLIAGEIRMIGAAGSMTLDPTGIKLFDGDDPAADNVLVHLDTADGSIEIKSADAGDRLELDSAGLRLYDGVNLLIDLNTTNATFSMKSGTAGNPRIEIDNTEVAGYDGGDVKQFYLSAADGVAYAGGGSVRLDAGGLQIISDAPVAPTEMLRFLYDDVGVEKLLGQAYSDWAGGANIAVTWLTSWRQAGDPWPADNRVILAAVDSIVGADVRLTVYSSGLCTVDGADLHCSRDVRIGRGLYVGQLLVDPPADDVWVDNDVRIGNGLYVGNLGNDPPDNEIWVTGDIRSGGGMSLGSLAVNPLIGELRCTSDIRCGAGLYVGGTGVNPVSGEATVTSHIAGGGRWYFGAQGCDYYLHRSGENLMWHNVAGNHLVAP